MTRYFAGYGVTTTSYVPLDVVLRYRPRQGGDRRLPDVRAVEFVEALARGLVGRLRYELMGKSPALNVSPDGLDTHSINVRVFCAGIAYDPRDLLFNGRHDAHEPIMTYGAKHLVC